MDRILNESRRSFLKAGLAAGAGLTLGLYFDWPVPPAGAAAAAFEPNAFVRIGRDGRVTVIAKHLEMGQGAYTGLATLLAEELDADWASLEIEAAPADATRYNNTFWGPMQGVGGSTGLANSWQQMRRAGAAARAMLVAAASAAWGVPAGEIRVAGGVISHPASGRRASFGELVERAAALPVPAEVTLKDPRDYVLVGKAAPRKDARAKIAGAAVFTSDVRLPDMLVALVAHPPRFGAKLAGVDAAAAPSGAARRSSCSGTRAPPSAYRRRRSSPITVSRPGSRDSSPAEPATSMPPGPGRRSCCRPSSAFPSSPTRRWSR